MSDSTFTQTGLDQFKQAVDRLPSAVTKALRSVAMITAHRVKGDAQHTLRSQLKTNAHKLADAIEIEEDAPNKAFLVNSKPPSGQPRNLPIWIEHGTSKMAARPYMRPPADRARDQYTRDVEAASAKAAEDTFGK